MQSINLGQGLFKPLCLSNCIHFGALLFHHPLNWNQEDYEPVFVGYLGLKVIPFVQRSDPLRGCRVSTNHCWSGAAVFQYEKLTGN